MRRLAVTATRMSCGNPTGMFYGVVVSASVLAIAGDVVETVALVVLAVVFVLMVYWLAHLYASLLAEELQNTGVPLSRSIRATMRHEAAVLVGGVPAVVVLLLDSLFRPSVSVAVDVALVVIVVTLTVIGYSRAIGLG